MAQGNTNNPGRVRSATLSCALAAMLVLAPVSLAVALSLFGAAGAWVVAGPGLTGVVASVLAWRLVGVRTPDLDALERAAAAERAADEADRQAALLRARAGELERVMDAVDEPVVVVGSDDRVMLCNDAAVRLLSTDGQRVAGRTMDEVFLSDELVALCQRARDGQTHRRRLRLRRDGEASDFDASAAPIGVAGGSPHRSVVAVVLTLLDVTELARAVSVKTDFVANASHELRTPISAIYAATETLEDAGPDEADLVARLVRVIRVHAQRLNELVGDLLDLSRLESPETPVEMDDIDAGGAIAAACEPFGERMSDRSLDLSVEIDSGCETLRSDRKLFGLIVRNLVDNATKFAREGSTVELHLSAQGAAAVLVVRDRGLGIPIDQQRRIFERFYQVDPARTGGGKRGTGLGLAIVKHASLTLGGDVTLESVWQRGSKFTVRLPAAVGRGQD